MSVMAGRILVLWILLLVAATVILTITLVTASKLEPNTGVGLIVHQFRLLYPGEGTQLISIREYIYDLQYVFFDRLTAYNIILGSILVGVTYFIYRQLFEPYCLIRHFGDAGYITDGNNKKEVANAIRKRRRAGDVPPVYPNGWFSVLRSWELKQGEVKYVSALGQELAVYRGHDNQAYIVDAYCPHLGANLGVGGQVKGDCIECPFHGWVFRGSDGKCIDVPYTKKVPEFAKTRAWRSVELNGEIFMWFHAEGEEPDWFPPEIKGITTGQMKFHGYTEHYVNSHIEEIPENGADVAHLHHLHTPFLASGTDLRYKFSWAWEWIKHVWDGGWRQDEENKHVGILTLHHKVTAFGKTVPLTSLVAKAHQIGPGLCQLDIHHSFFGYAVLVQTVLPVEPLVQKLVHCIYSTTWIPRPVAKIFMWVERSQMGPGITYLHLYLAVVGEVVLIHCVTPIEPLVMKLTHCVFTPWYVPRIIGKLALWAESIQIERDLMIWNHKTFLNKPLLMKEDSLIARHRRWYSQFYSKNSPRYSPRIEGMDW